jgi:predicted DsbA family dithiol-disulfide isomerase
MNEMKMKVDIWSDIMCPFCYIGKRKFEQALEQFPQKDKIEVVWHSFQLDPTIQDQPGKDLYSYLAERKGQSREWSVQVHEQVTQTAKQVGLDYRFDKAVIANSFDAHRFIQLAKTHSLGDAAEERLFKAYFTEGKNVSNTDTLVELGKEIGLEEAAIKEMLSTNAFAEEVGKDIDTAQQIGINGVPFFVLDDRLGVSGAQAPETFSAALNQAWQEYAKQHPQLEMVEGDAPACGPDECEVPNNK